MKAITESIILDKDDFKLLKEKGRIYAEGELKGLSIELVYKEVR